MPTSSAGPDYPAPDLNPPHEGPENPVFVGHIVHHVSQDTLECCAAIVTRVFQADDGDIALGTVGVTFFAWADGTDTATTYECQEKPIPGTWHWPERCTR